MLRQINYFYLKAAGFVIGKSRNSGLVNWRLFFVGVEGNEKVYGGMHSAGDFMKFEYPED